MTYVAISIPTRDVWKANFGLSLAMLMAATPSLVPDGIRLRVQSKTQCSIPKVGRTELVNEALKAGCTHVLFLDDDMMFPMNTLARLLKHDVDFVGLNCPTKSSPPVPTARDMENKRVYTTKDSTGIESVRSIGNAVSLIKTSVFEKIKKPWFDEPWLPGGEQLGLEVINGIGADSDMDRFFCHRLREAGLKVYIDHDLSKEVRHIGDWFYCHQMMEEFDAPDKLQRA